MAKNRRGRETGARGRSRARRLAMQALYQWQLNADHEKNIYNQYLESEEIQGVDIDYFRDLVIELIQQRKRLDATIEQYADRSLEQLDPVEYAILLVGMYELTHRVDVPYRVVINEAVELSKRFGAADGYKYINALLDRAAKKLRAAERDQQ